MRTVLPLLVAAVLAAGLAACGGSGRGMTSTRAAAALPGSGKPPVTLGTQSVTEQVLLGQLYQQALEARGFTVALKQNIGSTQIAEQALRSRKIDLYPAYIGVFDMTVVRVGLPYPSARSAFVAGQAYARAGGSRLLPMTPFSTTDALVVLPDYARAHHLRSVAGLAAISGLKLGASPDFRQSEAGLRGLARVYRVRDVDFAPLTVGLQYQALNDGQIDVADVLTTDGQLQSGRYVVLADPKHVFGFQNVTPVVSQRVLRAEGPAFAAALDAVSRALSTSAMQRMNAAVALNGKSPGDVARQFLQAAGLV